MKFFHAYLVLLALALNAGLAQSPGASLSGVVLDGQGQPAPYVRVWLESRKLQTLTDLEGKFEFRSLSPGEDYLNIVSGAFAYREKLIIRENEALTLSINSAEAAYEAAEVSILGHRNKLLRGLPGAAAYIGKEELKLLAPVSGNEALRRVAGVHVVDEEGAGLRINIGLRGLDPDRSRNVLILEDGIPVALNPYGEPEMYYTPSIDRMSGVEVLKGSGQILFGPQTIGGVINYLTADPPAASSLRARLQGGQGGYFSGNLSYGNTYGNTGLQINLLRRQSENLGPTEFQLNDLSTKVRIMLSDKSVLGLKLGVYDERSNSTYIGLTQTMYDRGGEDFVRMAPDDELQVRRYSVSAHHTYTFAPRLSLKTTAFAYTTTRNWRRQDFSSSATASNRTGVVWGDPSIPGGAVYMRNSTGARNRQFEVAGAESRLTWDYQIGSLRSELIAGGRYLYEKAYEQRVNGSKADAASGSLVEDEIRDGNALSAFAQNKIRLSDAFELSVGLRAEQYGYERQILRRTYRGSVRDTNVVAGNKLFTLIPGAGLSYSPGVRTQFFAGVHRGFAPPRVKDAISDLGEPYELDAEQSLNYEAGLRSSLYRGIYIEATAFLMDFSNQIIPVSESSGGTGSGLLNGGRTRHRGIEAVAVLGIGELFRWKYRLDFDLNATIQQANFSSDRFKPLDGESVNLLGKRTPYAPNNFLSSALSFQSPGGLQARLTATYVGDQFGDELNSTAPSADGRTGPIEAYYLLDATLQYSVSKLKSTFFVSGKNLTNERYIASRRPQGIRVGLPRLITAGVTLEL